MTIQEYIIKHEGLKLKPYHCTADKLTIGIGRNIEDKGITKEESLFLLDNDLKEVVADLKAIFPEEWDKLSTNRQMVLIDMRFQLGGSGFREFKRLIAGVKAGDWQLAKKSIESSAYYKQVPNRAQENIKLLVEG